MRCVHCGTPNRNNVTICGACGNPVARATGTPSTTHVTQQPATGTPANPTPQPATAGTNVPPPPTNNGNQANATAQPVTGRPGFFARISNRLSSSLRRIGQNLRTNRATAQVTTAANAAARTVWQRVSGIGRAIKNNVTVSIQIVLLTVLAVIVVFGAYSGSWIFLLLPIGLMPLCVGWKLGLSLFVRATFCFVWEGVSIAICLMVIRNSI